MNNEEYLKVSNNEIFNNYQIIKTIGKGAFSQVYKVIDKKNQIEYALKIGRISLRFQKSYENEIELLNKLNNNENPNIIKMINNFKINNRFFLVFEIYGNNLYNYFKKFNQKQIGISKTINFTNQIINGLKLLKKLKIIHADLKPENILVSDNGDNIKIIDFGSSFIEKKNCFYNYIQTRYYRSPEVLMGLEITHSIDIWSLGCIIYEMIRGYPLFKARNYQDLFLYHVHVLGIPDKKLINNSKYGEKYFIKNKNTYKLKKINDSKNLFYEPKTREIERYITNENKELFDIIFKCIQWYPKSRLNLDKY